MAIAGVGLGRFELRGIRGMSEFMKALGLDRLSVDDRIRLAGDLWDSIAEDDLPPLTKAQEEMLMERLAAPDATLPMVTKKSWHSVRAFYRIMAA